MTPKIDCEPEGNGKGEDAERSLGFRSHDGPRLRPQESKRIVACQGKDGVLTMINGLLGCLDRWYQSIRRTQASDVIVSPVPKVRRRMLI